MRIPQRCPPLTVWVAVLIAALVAHAPERACAEPAAGNLVADPSFEEPMPRDQFGHVFKQWGGWKFEGDCEFRVGRIAHTGSTSCLLFGASQPKIRISQTLKSVPAGRYKVTAWLRGLDIGEGQWHMTTELAFDGKYMRLNQRDTFGWTPLTYVAELKENKEKCGLEFGLWGAGYFWIDDVAVVRVSADVPLTPEPVLGKEDQPIEPPAPLTAAAVRCPNCGYRNLHAWKTCYACGAELAAATNSNGPATRSLTSFEDKSPFSGGQITDEHATDGKKSMRIDSDFVTWNATQDWSGYDYLKVDVYTDADQPLPLSIELRDRETRDYWTRVNHETLVPPGKSTLVLPLAQLYVGEKSRPGRNLLTSAVTHLVFILGPHPPAPLYLDNLRLERDTETPARLFEGLFAFDFGTATSPLMPGFTRIDPSTVYSRGRGYGLKDARVWRAMDVKQPDPLYQDYLCVEQGGLAVDVPNGSYRVFLNIDNPSGFWGEYQTYRARSVLAEGRPVVEEGMTFDSFNQKYFRNWDTEDSAADDTFDKYQRPYYHEKQFDVEVADGQLNLDFRGQNVACSVSAVVIYPANKAEDGQKFLDYTARQRRFFFDNYFHRVVHQATGDELAPTAADRERGYVVFERDYMQDVYDNDTPRRSEVDRPLVGFGFAGEYEPLTVSICPLQDLGKVTVTATDLYGPGTISAANISVGYVSNRLTRVSGDGAVYTIAPRLIIPRNAVEVRKGVTRRFWLDVHAPATARPGVYRGVVTIAPQHGQPTQVPLEYRVYPGTLDEVDIPVGPWSHEINTPWDGSDPAATAWNDTMAERSLERIRAAGFTTVSGLPRVRYQGHRDGKPVLDFSEGDRQMARARRAGFTMPVVTYTEFGGLNLYTKDLPAMQAAGFSDYSQFVKSVFTGIQQHADSEGWLPVYWNLGDEPLGDDLVRAAENAEAYRAAFPNGPPVFTGATSFSSGKADDPHFRFAKALHVPNLNEHNAESIRLLQAAGSQWAFYNGGNRWTYGTYLYKAAKEFDLKFRLNWHWNAVAGDPYYALDCREDDYAWCNTNAAGELIPAISFERDMREGVDDYRYLLTLARLADETQDAAARQLITERMSSFQLGQREHDALYPPADWRDYRRKLAEAIGRLRAKDSK